jgi:predicted DNA-binding protein
MVSDNQDIGSQPLMRVRHNEEGNGMTITIELPPELKQQLEEEAARQGQAPADYVRAVVEEKLTTASTVAQMERNRRAMELLDQWLAEPPDPEEEAGYPLEITPLSLREISIE